MRKLSYNAHCMDVCAYACACVGAWERINAFACISSHILTVRAITCRILH